MGAIVRLYRMDGQLLVETTGSLEHEREGARNI